MSKEGILITTPVGRHIWGSMSEPRKKTHKDGAQKGQPVLDAEGKPVMEISFGLAIPKFAYIQQLYPTLPPEQQAAMSFEGAVWPAMQAEIASIYTHGVPQRFAYKYKDGDTDMDAGTPPKPLREREGYAGHIVLSYTQRITDTWAPPPIFKYNPQTLKYDTLSGADVKCGDYFAIGTHFKCEPAQGTNTPSIYVNPKGIELVGYGTAIVSATTVDPNAMFGGATRALPPGASAVPMQQPGAPTMPGMAAAPGMPQMAAPPVMAPVAPVMAPAAPQMAAPPVMAPAPVPIPVAPPVVTAGPVRPVDPTHVHNNGNGTEQWLINGQWDGQQHPIAPAPAHDFVANAGYVAPQPVAMPGMPAAAAPGNMPGMMPQR